MGPDGPLSYCHYGVINRFPVQTILILLIPLLGLSTGNGGRPGRVDRQPRSDSDSCDDDNSSREKFQKQVSSAQISSILCCLAVAHYRVVPYPVVHQVHVRHRKSRRENYVTMPTLELGRLTTLLLQRHVDLDQQDIQHTFDTNAHAARPTFSTAHARQNCFGREEFFHLKIEKLGRELYHSVPCESAGILKSRARLRPSRGPMERGRIFKSSGLSKMLPSAISSKMN
jgi:hypothetical protein